MKASKKLDAPLPPMTPEQREKFGKCLSKWERRTQKRIDDMKLSQRLTAADMTLRVGNSKVPTVTKWTDPNTKPK